MCASSSPCPASSRALRPSAVRIADLCVWDMSPSKNMAENQLPIFIGWATINAIMLRNLYSWNFGSLPSSCRPTIIRASSVICSRSSVPNPVLRRINEGAVVMPK